jgi:uncharacterized MAPEG superfamily protein
MSTELLCLVWSTALGFAYISGQVVVLYAERGIRSYDSRRDRVFTPGLYTSRGDRALRNFLETYPFFVALVAAAELSGGRDWFTAWGAIVYIAARVLYWPFYVAGLGYLRTTAWTIASIGLAMMFYGVLF